MNWLQRQPAMAAVIPFAVGISIAKINIAHVVGWLCFLSFLILSMIGYCFSWQKRFVLVSTLAWLSVGFLALRQAQHSLPDNEVSCFADLPILTTIEGTICRAVDHQDDKLSAVVAIDSVWVRGLRYSASGYCCLKHYDPAVSIDYGDHIVARGHLRIPDEARNPGEFNYRKYLAVEKIHCILAVSSPHDLIVLKRHQGGRFYRWGIIPVRKFIIGFIDEEIGGQPGALLKGLLIGAREDLDDQVKNAFAKVGVIHVLAVSGLHVGFIAVLLWGFTGFIRLRDPWRTLLVLLGLTFYGHLTGLKPAVVRSVIMAAIILLGPLLQRKSNILNSLGIAALIILTLNPLQLFEVGFQLSFFAVAGIGLFSKRILDLVQLRLTIWADKGKGILLSIVSLAAVSIAAQLATLPLTAYYFNRVPVYSMMANLIVIPTVSLIVTLGFSTLILAAMWHFAGTVLANVVWLLLTLLIKFIALMESIPLASISVSSISTCWMLIYVNSLLLFLNWQEKSRRKWLIFSFLILFNGLVYQDLIHHARGLMVTFLDVGQGDAALLEFPGGKSMLIDAGDRTETIDYGQQVILPFLQRRGIHDLDALLLTHSHSDHIGGAISLLQNMKVKRIIKNSFSGGDPCAAIIDSLVECKRIPQIHPLSGDTLSIDEEVLLLVMHPSSRFVQPPSIAEELNNSSIVLMCKFYNHAILFCGDAEIPAEQEMLRFGNLLKCDILKVGHHGSATAGSEQFRDMTSPNIAVVSVAKRNRFGLPSERLLSNMEKEGIRVLRTSDQGAIEFLLSRHGEKL